MVSADPGVPPTPRPALRLAARSHRRRDAGRALLGRRTGHSDRGLSGDPPRAGDRTAASDRGGKSGLRPVVRAARRISRLGRISRPQPQDGTRDRSNVRRKALGRRLPLRHVRPQLPDAADPGRIRHQGRARLAWCRRPSRRQIPVAGCGRHHASRLSLRPQRVLRLHVQGAPVESARRRVRRGAGRARAKRSLRRRA